MSIQKSFLFRGGLGLCAALLSLQAHAVVPTPEQLQHMPAATRVETMERLISQQASRRLPSNSSGPMDVTPPALTAFNAGTELNADDINAQIQFSFSVSDDLSGVDYLYIHISSPSGRQQSWTGMTLYGQRNFSGKVGKSARPYSEVGLWSVQEVFGADLAGNFFYCESACLSKLGNIQFAVVATISDTQPPILDKGKVLTPQVSLSKPSKGTVNGMPFISARLTVTDVGPSGVGAVGASFCRLGVVEDCLFIHGPTNERDLGNNASVIIGTSLYNSRPGVYELHSVWVEDRAGNVSEYTSVKFGGETDFGPLFPSTTVTLVR